MGDVLIVAFDGLDYDLIREYSCDTIMQEEFGLIDNHTDVVHRMTSELYISFITGRPTEEHGNVGLGETEEPWKRKVRDALELTGRAGQIPGYTRVLKAIKELLDINDEKYSRKHLDVDTWFDEVLDSTALFVPGYNPSVFWKYACGLEPLRNGGTNEESYELVDRDSEYRKRRLMQELEKDDPPSLLMCHFQKPDTVQHLYAPDGNINDEEKMRETYQQMDTVAGEIIEAADGKYDTIIFMSDHGLPEISQHNRKAFYSCNHELFGDEEPRIIGFHDPVLERIGDQETGGLDI